MPLRPATTIATGIHPTTRLPLLGDARRAACGSCVHLVTAYEGRVITEHTCDLVADRILADPAWPACAKHEKG